MRAIQGFAFAAALLSSNSEALQLHKRVHGPARVLGLEIQRRENVDPLQHDRLRRRAGEVQVTLDNEVSLYFANVTVGTPPQSIRVPLDTGSSDLWFNTPSSALCKSRGSPCQLAGSYTANSSSTYSYVASDFNITYVDGSGAAGDYATDTVRLGGATITKQQFGIGYVSTSDTGILGVGYPSNEVQVNRDGKSAYNNVPASLVAQGLISSNAYSLYLNDLDASTGNILFGGVDTDRFTGKLATLPVQQFGGAFTDFLVTLTSVSVGSTVIGNNLNLAVLLDSGTSLTFLPTSLVSSIYSQTGAQLDTNLGAGVIKCSAASSSTPVSFTFSGATISIPMSELVVEAAVSNNGRQLSFSDGSPACIFGIAPNSDTTISILGDTFLRSAYVVYDLDNNEVSLAQTKFNVTTSNILEIGTGANAVPSASAVVNPAAATGIGGGVGAGVTLIPTATVAATSAAADGGRMGTRREGLVVALLAVVGAGLWVAL